MLNLVFEPYDDIAAIRIPLRTNAHICSDRHSIVLYMLIRLSVTIHLITVFFRQNDEPQNSEKWRKY